MKCRGCHADKLELILDLGEQPWCNNFLTEAQLGSEPKYPLRLNYCKGCELLQLDHTVAKETMFADHCYLSGVTQTLQNHFYEVAAENVKQFAIEPDDLVVDIGGNDGTQLMQYQKCGINNVLNIECARRVSQIAIDNGVRTVTDYFSRAMAEEYLAEASVRLYNASGVFFHLEELHSVIDAIKWSLREDGVLIVQFMYAGTMVEKLNFDTIYHEHLCYYTLRSLNNLVGQYGLEIFDAYYSEIHSGSIVAKITHKEGSLNQPSERFLKLLEKDKKYTIQKFYEFAQQIEGRRSGLKDLLTDLKAKGATIYAYGAPAKGNTLLNYFGIDKTLVDKAVEINDLKIGTYLPQSHIPITRESARDRPDYYLLLSHNFADEIIMKNEELIAEGVKFIVPFPSLKIVTDTSFMRAIVQLNEENVGILPEMEETLKGYSAADATRCKLSQFDSFAGLAKRVWDRLGSSIDTVLELGSGATPLVQHFQSWADEANQGLRIITVDGNPISADSPHVNAANHYIIRTDIDYTFANADTQQIVQFDLIVSYEHLEHLNDTQLLGFVANLKKHMHADSIFIATASMAIREEHVSAHPLEWWTDFFSRHGFEALPELAEAVGTCALTPDKLPYNQRLESINDIVVRLKR